MSAEHVRIEPSLLVELDRGGAGRPEDIARRLGPDWTEDDVPVALAALLDGVVGHNREIGFWWGA